MTETIARKKRRIGPVVVLLLVAGVVAFALLSSCEKELDAVLEGPLTFDVKIVQGDPGSENSPLAFSFEPRRFVIDIQAVDHDGEPADWYDGTAKLSIAPNGMFEKGQAETVELKNGKANGVSVEVRYLHSTTYIWVEDAGTEQAPGSFATGLSDPIVAQAPTLRNLQEPDGPRSTPLTGQFVRIRTQGRTLIVTGVTNDGFYVTDISEPEGIFNGMFVYNHSRPRDVNAGDRITRLSGNVDLYYGFTEMGFPAWKIEQGSENDLPAPLLLTARIVSDQNEMEQYESRLVAVQDVVVCPISEEDTDFEQYGQWQVALPGGECGSRDGTIKVVSAFSDPDFDPKRNVGEIIDRVEGNLRYHISAGWLIYLYGENTLGGDLLEDY